MEDNIPAGRIKYVLINSDPPIGKCKITNLYVDPSTGKLIIEYDETPQL